MQRYGLFLDCASNSFVFQKFFDLSTTSGATGDIPSGVMGGLLGEAGAYLMINYFGVANLESTEMRHSMPLSPTMLRR